MGNPSSFLVDKTATVKWTSRTHMEPPTRIVLAASGAFVSPFSENRPDDLERGAVGVPFFTVIFWTMFVRTYLSSLNSSMRKLYLRYYFLTIRCVRILTIIFLSFFFRLYSQEKRKILSFFFLEIFLFDRKFSSLMLPYAILSLYSLIM